MSENGDEIVQIEGKLIAETPMAWLIDCHAGKVWLPKSQVSMTNSGIGPSFNVPLWLAEKKN